MILSSLHRRSLAVLRVQAHRALSSAEVSAAETVNKIVVTNDIVVFSSESCKYCGQAIQALEEAGKKPFVIKVNVLIVCFYSLNSP